jgi:hypothetical protein
MKFNPVHSDLRVCALKEPKSEPGDSSSMFGKLMKIASVLSKMESQGSKTQGISVPA